MEYQHIQQHDIAVIGSGIAGCLAAKELASEGFSVTMFEESLEPFSGTSAGAIQAHLGGLYSGSPETAQECLRSAIEIKKSMPFALNSRKALFLVANKSEVSFGDYLSFYQDLTDYYADRPASDQVLGSPHSFSRILQKNEYDFAKNVQGGIATNEPGLDMARTRRALLSDLGRIGVKIITSTEITEADARKRKFVLNAASGGEDSKLLFDQVVNAGGYKARLLDHQLGDRTQYNLYLKTWNIVKDTSGRTMPPFYVVRGDFMHYSPIGEGELSSLITATNEGSYVDAIEYNQDMPILPSEWTEMIKSGHVPDKMRRQQTIIEYAADEFLKNAQLEPVDLIPGVAVSFSASRQDRTRRGARQVVTGWQTIVPTKVTNALELAREAREYANSYARNR